MTYIRILNKLSPKFPVLIMTSLSVIITGCSSVQVSNSPATRTLPVSTSVPATTIEQQLARAALSTYPKRAELTLSATGSLLKTDFHRARTLLNALPYDELSSELQAQISLQQAQIAQLKGQNSEVFYWLDREPVITSSNSDLLALSHILRAQTYSRFGEHVAALDEWLTGLPMLHPDERKAYQDGFWQSLLRAPSERLKELYDQTRSNQMKGWLALALIYQPGTPLDQQLSNLKSWKNDWSGHPASDYLPKNFDALQNSTLQRVEKIAALLPLSGKLGKAGESVRDGILAAHYKTITKNEPSPEITFYDTSNKNINELAHYAIEQGAQLIVGPLTKTNVQRLQSDVTASTPILALNYIDDDIDENKPNGSPTNPYRPHFYQFGLSAEDEVQMVVNRGWLDGHRRAIVITPETEWGKKISHTFVQAWTELGGKIAATDEFPAKVEFSQFAGKVLQTDQSQARARLLSRQLGEKLGFQPRRRQDVDMIFMGANPTEARQLKPALAYQFAGSVPVYSTSSTFSGTSNRNRDQDMDGIRIPVMPWLIPGVQSPLEKQMINLWPQARGQYGTLYALGADAYQLYPRLQQLQVLQGSQVPGLTGSLSISLQGKVQRELTWQIFRNGQLVPLPVTRPNLSTIGFDSYDHALAISATP